MYGSLLLGRLITCSGPGLCVSFEFAECLPVEVSSLLSSSTIMNHSAADATVDEESNDDTSTGRRSANSNETHRPGPEHVINRPRSNDPYTLHPQRDYLHDINVVLHMNESCLQSHGY